MDYNMQYMKMANKMQLYRIIYYSLAAQHVSIDIFAHHQEHLWIIFYNFFVRTNLTKIDSIPQVPLHSQVENVIND
jgi:hypothetical protein